MGSMLCMQEAIMFGSRTKTHSQFEQVSEKNYIWRSADKNFFYYDKDSETRVPLPEGAKLIPLTTANSITGIRERDHGKATQRFNQIFSNEFTDYKDEIVRVRENDRLDGTKTVLFEGVYSPTVRDAISGVQWCKFTKNVYCLLDGEVVKLSLSGSSLTSWIEFEDKCKKDRVYLVDGHCITLGESSERKTGSVSYNAPTFELGDISDEENTEADKMAAIVEEKIARNKAATGTVETVAQVPTPKAETAEEPSDSAEINLDEVPF